MDPDEQDDLAEFLRLVKEAKATKVKMLVTSRRGDQTSVAGRHPQRVRVPRMSDSDAASLARQSGHGREQIARHEKSPSGSRCSRLLPGQPLTLRGARRPGYQMGLHGQSRIEGFVEAIRSGEQVSKTPTRK